MKLTTYSDSLNNPAEQVELRMSKREAEALASTLDRAERADVCDECDADIIKEAANLLLGIGEDE